MIKITLNNKEVLAPEGSSILDVARKEGYKIPTLCHDEELKPFGSCWVCAVKVEGRRGFVTSCGTVISEGMVIDTEGEEIRKARKVALELILSDHYADCEAPCKIACPAKIDVQSYLSLIANKQYHEAVSVIKSQLPMPLSVGRICPAFCEEECRRQIVDEAIAIRQLKRFAADYDAQDYWSYIPEREGNKHKKVAIIGGGPSGLTCGYYLSNQGYQVKVFESMPKPGGWLRYGIPEYRLPKEILDTEIELMCANGMQIECNAKIGDNISFNQLRADYDAVYVAIGASEAVPMHVPGSHLRGCYLGVDFLRDYALGNPPDLGKRVIVIGGGNTAIDCVRTVSRLGAKATIVYRRAKEQMPAENFEIEAAEHEGVEFKLLTNPVEYFGELGQLKRVKLEKMVLGEPDATGRRSPQPTGEYEIIEVDSVIAAISQKPNLDFMLGEDNFVDGKELPFTRWNTIKSDETTMYTGLGNVFAGGDVRRGPSTAVEAIADGKIASETITRFLKGENIAEHKYCFNSVKANKLEDVTTELFSDYEKIPRAIMPEIEISEAKSSFSEVEIGFSEKEAVAEANRCLECGCKVNEICSLRKYASEYNVTQDVFIGSRNEHPVDHSHPFILRDANKCIDCSRCVRTCAEIQGAGVLGYINRGFKTFIAPEFGESLNNTTCESCGKCIAVCPTGALVSKNINYKLHPLENRKVIQSCGMCGTGCDILIDVHTNVVSFIASPAEEPADLLPMEYDYARSFNGRNLCYKGRFGWQTIDIKPTLPRVKVNGKWQEIDYLQLQAIIKEKLNVGFKTYLSPNLSIEEMLLGQEIAKHQKQPISWLQELDDYHKELLTKSYTVVSKEHLSQAENYILVGEISHTLRTLIRLEQRKGKTLTLVNYPKIDFVKFADYKYNNINEIEDLSKPKTIFVYDLNKVSIADAHSIYQHASQLSDFNAGSYIYLSSTWNNLRAVPFIALETRSNDQVGADIFYGDLPLAYKKDKFTVLISDVFVENTDIDLFIPKPSYLEIEAVAFADDMRIKVFSNAKKSNLQDMLVNTLVETQLIPISMAEMSNWNNRADAFIQTIEFNDQLMKLGNTKKIDALKTYRDMKVARQG
ncbi:MAG: FAD-dependent oxidoreductase [Candidatus Cloacimonadales bacterium]